MAAMTESEGFSRVELRGAEFSIWLQGEHIADRYVTALVSESDFDAHLSEN